jgi:hypothetical protein
MHTNGLIAFNVDEYPILHYAAYFFIAFAAKDLFKEAFKEKESILKIPSMIFAIFLLFFTAIPTLHKLGVIDFTLPQLPLINNIIYIVSGVFLIIGIFTLMATKEE